MHRTVSILFRPRLCRGSSREHLELNYAKQTQFAAHPNERNYCTNKGLSKHQTIQTPEKQTQFQPHRPRTAQPTIIMQNKPNLQKQEMNLTPYYKTAYGGFRVCSPRKNKPNQTQFQPKNEPQKSPLGKCPITTEALQVMLCF